MHAHIVPPPPPFAVEVPRERVEPERLDALSDEQLDSLPYGVICLAPDGLILRYNVAEGRLARLDPNTVVGRNFFTDVAPCTNTPEFFGRFKDLVGGTSHAPVVRFPYVFDFRFGAQEVDVEMLRTPGSPRFYLLVNRLEMLEQRSPSVAREPAPAQSELEQGERDKGIVRDDFAERFVAVPVSALRALCKAGERSDPEQWRALAHAWGVEVGRRLVIELETTSFEDQDRELRARTIEDVADAVDGVLSKQGWGRVVFDFWSSSTGALRIELSDSAFVGQHASGQRSCHMVAGTIEAVLSYLAGRRLHAEEIRCAGAHDCSSCEIIVVGQGRRERVMELAHRGLAFDEMLAQLGREP